MLNSELMMGRGFSAANHKPEIIRRPNAASSQPYTLHGIPSVVTLYYIACRLYELGKEKGEIVRNLLSSPHGDVISYMLACVGNASFSMTHRSCIKTPEVSSKMGKDDGFSHENLKLFVTLSVYQNRYR